MTIALHEFGSDGRCVNVSYGGKRCNKRFCDISFAAYGAEWLGQMDISCRGAYLENEQVEVAAMADAYWSGVVCAASGKTPSVQEDPPMHDDAYVEF